MNVIPFSLTTRSETLFGGGNEIPGYIDQDFESDEFGFPIVGGKRIKGLLVEACADVMAATGSKDRDAAKTLFGETGSRRTRVVHFGNAELASSLRSKVIYEGFRPEEIKTVYGVIRRMTAIDDETDAAADRTLRTYRMLRAGVTLQGRLIVGGFEWNLAHSELLR